LSAGIVLTPPLALHGEDAVQGGGGDVQALGGGDVVLHRLIHPLPADHQDAGPAQVVPRHIQAVLMLLGDAVMDEAAGEQDGADGRVARFVHLAAIAGGGLGVVAVVAAPGGGDVGEGSFHGKVLSPGVRAKNKTAC